ncbi:hypothetical protein A2U01_0088380, partial [Trifolium medium]|nr:hypothetical protein [Trifolium medium]
SHHFLNRKLIDLNRKLIDLTTKLGVKCDKSSMQRGEEEITNDKSSKEYVHIRIQHRNEEKA